MLRTYYHSLSLKNKLAFILIASSMIISLIAGFYFDSFLQRNFIQTTKSRMAYAYHRISLDINTIEEELKKGIAFVQDDESLVASIELINQYQNKNDYDAILLDEEKKHIAQELLNRVKLSLNNDIALYDHNGDIIAYVTKTPQAYQLNFISYENGNPILYSRYENEYDYTPSPFSEHWLIPFHHISYYKPHISKIITLHENNSTLIIKSHQSIFHTNSKDTIAHIEMSHYLGSSYFSALSRDLGVDIWSTSKALNSDVPPLNNSVLNLLEEDERFITAKKISTKNGDIFINTALQRSELDNTLIENRQTFALLILGLTFLSMIVLRILFKRHIARPLQSLMEQIDKIENQNYSNITLIKTGDELESISKNIQELATTIQEREHALIDSQKKLEDLSNTDPLTNLPNRRLFNHLLTHAIDLAQREQQRLAVIFLDLDQFKQINDTLGHNIGDTLLQKVGERLENILRASDTLARIGGDEFNILIEGFNEPSDINPLLSKLISAFHTPFECGDHEIRTSASIGVSLYPDDGDSILQLIKNADLAMYRSKDTGRNKYTFFTQELANFIEDRSRLIEALKKAVESMSQFTLHYQPKVSAKIGKIKAIEALIRWNSPELGWVGPNRFIPLAEETGLILPLGAWILEQACTDFLRLREQGDTVAYISVNASAIQLEDHDFFTTLQEILTRTGMKPEWLEIEITESYIATNAALALETLNQLRSMNIKIAIDDFGTGYSSLSYLQKLPVDRLKIDKSFIDDLPFSNEGIAITRAIIALAKTFNLSITAEGVETREQLEFLENEGCDEIQGYYYAKPLSCDDLREFIATH